MGGLRECLLRTLLFGIMLAMMSCSEVFSIRLWRMCLVGSDHGRTDTFLSSSHAFFSIFSGLKGSGQVSGGLSQNKPGFFHPLELTYMCFRMQVTADQQRFWDHICTVATILLVADTTSLRRGSQRCFGVHSLYRHSISDRPRK